MSECSSCALNKSGATFHGHRKTCLFRSICSLSLSLFTPLLSHSCSLFLTSFLMFFAFACFLFFFIDLQSLWLTSWFGSTNNNSNNWERQRGSKAWQARQAGAAVDAGVYTLQQPHKFPLQLDVYGGNCSFDYQQHEQPVAHYRQQQQQQQQLKQQQRQQQEQQRQQSGKLRNAATAAAASTAQEQSTLSTRGQQRFLRISSDIDETKFIESSTATGKCKTFTHKHSHTHRHTHTWSEITARRLSAFPSIRI